MINDVLANVLFYSVVSFLFCADVGTGVLSTVCCCGISSAMPGIQHRMVLLHRMVSQL